MLPFHPRCIKTIWCNKMNADIKIVVMVIRIMETTGKEEEAENIMVEEDTIVTNLSSSTLEEVEVIMEASGAIGEVEEVNMVEETNMEAITVVNMEASGAIKETTEILQETGINISKVEVVDMEQIIEEEIIDG